MRSWHECFCFDSRRFLGGPYKALKGGPYSALPGGFLGVLIRPLRRSLHECFVMILRDFLGSLNGPQGDHCMNCLF